MSVLDFSGKAPEGSKRREGQKKEHKEAKRSNILPGQGELVAQGGVSQHSWCQDFQCMTAPFYAEKEAFTGN